MKNVILTIWVILLIATSCNKDKRNSKRLFKGEKWQVTELTVDAISDSLLPVLTFSECSIYEDTCTAQWKLSDTRKNLFYWQFNDKAQTFSISRQYDKDTADFVLDIVKWQCYQYSGTYQVIKSKKKEMIFESTETVGYVGKTVRMILERVD